MYENDLSILFRVALASVLSGILGWERESSGKSAGLRTHILVGISSVLFITISDTLIQNYRVYDATMRFDPVRVVEAIVTGISFLGAGIIVFRRGENSVKGLTTAAGILTTAAIGVLVGLNRFFLSITATVLVFIVLRFVSVFEKKFLERAKKHHDTHSAEKDAG